MKRLLILLPLLYAAFNTMCQTYIGRQLVDQYPITSWGTKTYGLTWLPEDYNSTTTNYPLIIFLHAGGEVGDGVQGLYNLLNAGIPKEIAAGWDPQAINPGDGKNYNFIVVSPQAPTNSGWSYSYTHVMNILPDILSRYRVDPKRIYITGISAGGAGTWSCVTNDGNFTQKIAAIIPVSAAGVNNPNVEAPNIKYISGKYGVSVWTVCGTQDALYNTAVSYVNTINTANPAPAVPAKLTGMAGLDHVPAVWDTAYKASWRKNVFNLNFYEWMLQYQRNVTSPPENKPPVANAGADKNIKLPTNTVTLTGSGTDADGTISSYLWTKISGPAQFSIVSPTSAQTVVNNLVAGTYQFELKVTDNKYTYRTDTVIVAVTSLVNKIPAVNAGTDQTITLPLNTVTLTGAATDSDGTISSYQWSKVGGSLQFNIVNPNQPQTVVNNLAQGTYQFELMVTDNQGASKKDTVAITVLPVPNKLPVVNAGNDEIIILPTDSVQLSGIASDTDGTIVSYLWTKINGPDQFTIVSPSQPQTLVNNLTDGVYHFVFKATDNDGASKEDTVTIIVQIPAPNKIPVAHAGNDTTIYQPDNSVELQGSGSDTDGVITSYQWSKISGPDEFSITSESDAQTTINDLIIGVYEFELTVTDDDDATGKDTIVITVMPPNQPPIVDAGEDETIVLPTNSVTLSGSASDVDGTVVSYNWSKVDGPDECLISSPTQKQTEINNLATGVYQFELAVTDNIGAVTKDTVSIAVLPAPNKPPVANAGSDQTINLPNNSVTLSGSGSDADGTIIAYLWSKVGGPDQFSITNLSQPQTTVNNLTEGIYLFELKVTDDSSASKTDTVKITVLAAPNQPPVSNAGNDQTITLPTNTVTLSGSGSDADGTVKSYAWTKVSGPSQFNISNSGITNPVLSSLVAGTYTFRLTVTDNNNASSSDDVNIIVNPMLAGYKTIPSLIQAESYNTMSGVQTENTSDAGGGLDVGWIDNGDYMDYNVYVDSTGTYTVNFRVATANTGAKFQLRKSDGTVLTTISLPNTSSYQGWITLSAAVPLTAGYQTLRIISTTTLRWNFNWVEFIRGASTGIPIPAKVEAENYYAMQGIQMEITGDSGGGLDVGWIDNGDWLDYDVNAAYAGVYTVNLRIATPNTGGKLQIKKSDGTVLSTVTIPKTNGWQTWSTVSTSITLPAGEQTLRFASTTANGFNFNWIQFVQSSGLIAQDNGNNQQDVERNSLSQKQLCIAVAPNPVRDKFVVQINNACKGTAMIQVFNMQGELKEEFKTTKYSEGSQLVSLSAATLTPGMYTVHVQMGKWSDSKLIIKL